MLSFFPHLMRERGAWVCALGSASACFDALWAPGRLLRVITRPDSRRLSRLGLEEFERAHQRASTAFPGALAPCPCTGSACQDHPEDPGPSGFTTPEAVHAKFVSPRRPRRCDLPCPRLACLTGFLSPRHLARRADVRPAIPKLRSTSKPPSDRAQAVSGVQTPHGITSSKKFVHA